jgi:hypothetical protein
MKFIIISLFIFSIQSHANSSCHKLYPGYVKLLKSLEYHYRKRDFPYIHKNIRSKYLKKHSYFFKNCLKENSMIKNINYGETYRAPLTSSYEKSLAKYGFRLKKKTSNNSIVVQTYSVKNRDTKIKRVIIKARPEMMTFIAKSNPFKHNPFKNLIPKEDPMYEVEKTSIGAYFKEESRIINIELEKLRETAKVLIRVKDFQERDYFKIKTDTLNYLDDDVLIIDIEE